MDIFVDDFQPGIQFRIYLNNRPAMVHELLTRFVLTWLRLTVCSVKRGTLCLQCKRLIQRVWIKTEMSSSYLSSYFYDSREVSSCKLSLARFKSNFNKKKKEREKMLNTFEFHLIILFQYKFVFLCFSLQ